MVASWTHRFLELALEYQALRFGSFVLKSGRASPYFFNAGLFCDGAGLDRLARCYADALIEQAPAFDVLFGPAYKGIPLAAAVAISLARDHGRNVPFAYNRKESKGHGEGGMVVGAPLQGRVLIVDDVLSAGTSINESIGLIRAAGAQPVAAAVALDRQERGQDQHSAARMVDTAGLTMISLARLDDLIEWLVQRGDQPAHLDGLREYRQEYGA